MIHNPLRHPNWDDVETLRDVLAAFNAADTTLAVEYSRGGYDGTGTPYHLINKAITNALIEIFDQSGFGQPFWWANRVIQLSLDSGERYSYSYRYILDHENLSGSHLGEYSHTGV